MHIASLIFPRISTVGILSPHDVLAYHDTSIFNYKQLWEILRASLFNYKQFVCEALVCKRDLIVGQWSLRHTQFGSVKAIEYIAGANF